MNIKLVKFPMNKFITITTDNDYFATIHYPEKTVVYQLSTIKNPMEMPYSTNLTAIIHMCKNRIPISKCNCSKCYYSYEKTYSIPLMHLIKKTNNLSDKQLKKAINLVLMNEPYLCINQYVENALKHNLLIMNVNEILFDNDKIFDGRYRKYICPLCDVVYEPYTVIP